MLLKGSCSSLRRVCAFLRENLLPPATQAQRTSKNGIAADACCSTRASASFHAGAASSSCDARNETNVCGRNCRPQGQIQAYMKIQNKRTHYHFAVSQKLLTRGIAKRLWLLPRSRRMYVRNARRVTERRCREHTEDKTAAAHCSVLVIHFT